MAPPRHTRKCCCRHTRIDRGLEPKAMPTQTETAGIAVCIRVKDRLDPRWIDWFDGLALLPQENGDTLLSGRLADQAALHGALRKVNSLGLTLLLVATEDYVPLC